MVLVFAATLVAGTAGPAAAHSGHSDRHRHGAQTRVYTLDPTGPAADAVHPEGVAADRRFLYTGSTTDGTIYRGRLSGKTATPFLPGHAAQEAAAPGSGDNRTTAIGLKVSRGKLFVAGGGTGRFFVYDLRTRRLVGSWIVPGPAPSDASPTFLNDEVVAPDGSVYVTDSRRPVLYRIPPGGFRTTGVQTLPVFVDFTGSPLVYAGGGVTNVNGIAATRNGKYLVLANSNTSELFRVRLADKQVTKIDLGGQLVRADGLLLKGRTLYAVERQGNNGFVVKIRMSRDVSRGVVLARVSDPTFNDPTTLAFARGRLLVTNSQFGERGGATVPFTISSIRRP
jgi:Cu-Zn family superoxide dismutase